MLKAPLIELFQIRKNEYIQPRTGQLRGALSIKVHHLRFCRGFLPVNIFHILVLSRPAYLPLPHCSHVGHRHHQPYYYKYDRRRRAHPADGLALEDIADLDGSDYKAYVGEDKGPPVEREVDFPNTEEDANGRQCEEPEANEPEKDAGRYTERLPEVAGRDAGNAEEVVWKNLLGLTA